MVKNLSKSDVERILPHRAPFLFVDEIVEVGVGSYAIGKKVFKEDEYFFKGHFPNNPIVPGVILIEFSAQVSAFMILLHDDYKDLFGYLLEVEDFRFLKKVLPGMEVYCKSEILDFRHNIARTKVEIFNGDTIFSKGVIKAYFVDKKGGLKWEK
ncbi:MAG: beta-hydroxyacyl-ACP dehydratase [Caldisericaceae bacterium]